VTSQHFWLLVLWICALLMAASCESIAGIPTRVSDADDALRGAAGAGASSTGCSRYCKQVNAACTGPYALYHGMDDCAAACKLFSEPELTCRTEQAIKAANTGDDYLHCPGASIGGSAACGSNCASYCRFMSSVCTGSNRDPQEVEDCERKCGMLIDREELDQAATQTRYNVDLDHEGDTLQCRLVHLTIAADPRDTNDHCWHAALAPRPLVTGDKEMPKRLANPCATVRDSIEPTCEDYCQIVMNACGGNDQVYESPEQCKAVCQKLDKGKVLDNAPETVACRKIHAYNAVAFLQPGIHCPHAGPGGDKVCGDDCNAYCTLLQAGCGAAFSKFGSGVEGLANCAKDCSQRHGTANLR